MSFQDLQYLSVQDMQLIAFFGSIIASVMFVFIRKAYCYIDDRRDTYKEEEIFISDWTIFHDLDGGPSGHEYVLYRINSINRKYGGNVQFYIGRVDKENRHDSGYQIRYRYRGHRK